MAIRSAGSPPARPLLTALLHRQRTGEGQYIDLAQVECLFPLVAPWLIEQAVTGKVAPKTGNRHPTYVPHGLFPCDGDDAWVAVAVDRRRSLACALRRDRTGATSPPIPSWPRPAAGAPSRRSWRRRSPPGRKLARRTRRWKRCRPLGVAAGAARGLAEMVLYEPHLLARGYWQAVERPHMEWPQQPSPVFREDGLPYPIRLPAPTLGQSSREVLTRLLGLTAAELGPAGSRRRDRRGPDSRHPAPPRSSALLHEAVAKARAEASPSAWRNRLHMGECRTSSVPPVKAPETLPSTRLSPVLYIDPGAEI